MEKLFLHSLSLGELGDKKRTPFPPKITAKPNAFIAYRMAVIRGQVVCGQKKKENGDRCPEPDEDMTQESRGGFWVFCRQICPQYVGGLEIMIWNNEFKMLVVSLKNIVF